MGVNSRLFQKFSEDYRRFLTTNEDFRGEFRQFSTLFSALYLHVKDTFCTEYRFFSENNPPRFYESLLEL